MTLVNNFTSEDLERYVKIHGSASAKRTLAFANNSKEVAFAMSTEVGKAILKDAVNRMDELLNKVLEDVSELTLEERIEYKTLKLIVNDWANKIHNWNLATNKLKGVEE